MPRESLVAFAGGDPWQGACGAVQLRLYLLDAADTSHSAVDRIAASERALRAKGFASTSVREPDSRGWLVERVRWTVDRGDYLGVGTMEYWSRAYDGGTMVLVFHWTTGPGSSHMSTERDWIVDGIVFGNASRGQRPS